MTRRIQGGCRSGPACVVTAVMTNDPDRAGAGDVLTALLRNVRRSPVPPARLSKIKRVAPPPDGVRERA